MKRRILLQVFLFFTFTFLLNSCKESTKPETVTFSGTVTLEGETDFSGVKVSLYKPVELDTALVRINQDYPQIGVQISQETEFDHLEHSPLYSSTTNASGAWKIENVTPGIYNVVAEKDSFGWRIIYNTSDRQQNFELTKQIDLTDYTTNVIQIPENSFISINKSITLSNQIEIVIGSGTIIEFSGDGYLEINGKFSANGTLANNISICSKELNNNFRIKFGTNSSTNIKYTNIYNLENGFYFSNIDTASVSHCRFSEGYRAMESSNCTKYYLMNSVITDMTQGVYFNNSKTNLYKNLIMNINENGITSLNGQNSEWKNNVIKNCNNKGIAINAQGTSYSNTWVDIYDNDLLNNHDHIILGNRAWCNANGNNFINEQNNILITSRIIGIDTLNFRNNYWNYTSTFDIDNKIIDLNDLDNGCIVDYQDYSDFYINW